MRQKAKFNLDFGRNYKKFRGIQADLQAPQYGDSGCTEFHHYLKPLFVNGIAISDRGSASDENLYIRYLRTAGPVNQIELQKFFILIQNPNYMCIILSEV